jgi:hypothetical protein
MTSLMGNQGYRGPAGGNLGEKVPSGYKRGTLQNYTPEQMQLFQQNFSQVAPGSYLNRLAGGDQEIFNQIEAPALRQFQELQGQTASRFSGAGMGARRGSGFQNTTNQATSDFAERLQSQRQQLQQQAIRDLYSMSHSLLGERPYENFLVKKQRKPSFWQRLLGGAAPIAGGLAGGFLGGPQGAAAGYSLGGSFGRGFMGQEDQGGIDWSGLSGLSNSWS